MNLSAADRRRIKWGYATQRIPDVPRDRAEAIPRIRVSESAPRANDVVVAEVETLGRHTRIDLHDKRRASLFLGDLVGVAFGRRYATRQFEGAIPESLDVCHMLAVGGVCGEVISAPPDMKPPTTLRPLGYLVDAEGRCVNLETHALRPCVGGDCRPRTVLAVGSAMDSGKTTAACSLIHGLCGSGAVVCAAKLTGTATVKDLQLMEDAGAALVLDFTDAGHASTAMCTQEQLETLATTILSHLTRENPDYIVLELADGLVQRETEMLLKTLGRIGCVDEVIYTCNDSLGVQAGIECLHRFGLDVIGISGLVACSPLAAREAQSRTDIPVLRSEALQDPSVIDLFTRGTRRIFAHQGALQARLPVEVEVESQAERGT